MPHLLAPRANSPTTLSARLRLRLGLTQPELGDLLGVSGSQVAHVEARRRGYSALVEARLRRLQALLARLPDPAGPVVDAAGPVVDAAATRPGPTTDERAALRRRLRHCRHALAGLTYREQGRPRLAALLARRTQALAGLRAVLAAPPSAAPAADPDPDSDLNPDLDWVVLFEKRTARETHRQPTPTALAWAALRRQLLEAEAQGLEALLGEPG